LCEGGPRTDNCDLQDAEGELSLPILDPVAVIYLVDVSANIANNVEGVSIGFMCRVIPESQAFFRS
jgi:hypothetical protein